MSFLKSLARLFSKPKEKPTTQSVYLSVVLTSEDDPRSLGFVQAPQDSSLQFLPLLIRSSNTLEDQITKVQSYFATRYSIFEFSSSKISQHPLNLAPIQNSIIYTVKVVLTSEDFLQFLSDPASINIYQSRLELVTDSSIFYRGVLDIL